MNDRNYSAAYNHLLGGLKVILRCMSDKRLMDLDYRSMIASTIDSSMDSGGLPADAGEREFMARAED